MKFASRIDLFTQDLKLNVKGKNYHQTELGGFCTIFAAGAIFYQIVMLLTKLILHDNAQVIIYSMY